jgi:hypothetical protein
VVAILSRIIVILSELTSYAIYLVYARLRSPNKNVREIDENNPKEVL